MNRHHPVRRLFTLILSILGAGVFACAGSMLVYVLLPPEPATILILGVDARPGEGYVTRTDSIMLVGVQPPASSLSLLSIPRDLFFNVPGYGKHRINTVNVLGEIEAEGRGVELLYDTFESNLGINPDHYVRLNFQAFVELVDAVGGVMIDVERLIVDSAYPTADYGTMSVRFEPGHQHMDGERALIYARTRHSDDDYRRAERQQQVLSAVAAKLRNPVYWLRALDVLNRYIDTSLTVIDIAELIPAVILSGGTFERLVIDRDFITLTDVGAEPNYALVRPWLDVHFD